MFLRADPSSAQAPAATAAAAAAAWGGDVEESPQMLLEPPGRAVCRGVHRMPSSMRQPRSMDEDRRVGLFGIQTPPLPTPRSHVLWCRHLTPPAFRVHQCLQSVRNTAIAVPCRVCSGCRRHAAFLEGERRREVEATSQACPPYRRRRPPPVTSPGGRS